VKVVEALRRRLVRERLAETGTAQQFKDRAAQHSARRQESTLITPYEYCAKLAAATPFYTCPPHICCEQLRGRFSRCGVRAAEKISEVDFLYGNPGRHAQRHTNHKPPFYSAHNVGLSCNLN
jgi:hypothetical protein